MVLAALLMALVVLVEVLLMGLVEVLSVVVLVEGNSTPGTVDCGLRLLTRSLSGGDAVLSSQTWGPLAVQWYLERVIFHSSFQTNPMAVKETSRQALAIQKILPMVRRKTSRTTTITKMIAKEMR